MNLVNKNNGKNWKLIGFFKEDKIDFNISKTKYIFNDVLSENISYFYLGEKEKLDAESLKKIANFIIKNRKRNFDIDVKTFCNKLMNEEEVIKIFLFVYEYLEGDLFSKKTEKNKKTEINLLTTKKISHFEKEILIAKQINKIRKLQDTPANILTTNKFVQEIEKELSKNKKIKTKILDHKEIEKLGMNLILAVNGGSKNKAKVLISELKNDPKNEKKIILIGKGIIFDSGGYDLKRGRHMLGMKYDMSGAAIAAYVLDTIAKLDLKVNISIVLPITDNLIDSKGTLPETIVKSLSGKTVEIVNTDAEGRLILADALTYSAKFLKPTILIDIATLTGSVISALGHEYTGVWSTSNKNWEKMEKASKNCDEKIWRMPLDKKYIDDLRKKTFADILSCSNTKPSDCNIAAAWLEEFTLEVPFMHLDIAGTGDINEFGRAPLLKTLIEFISLYFK
ncbi:MAG: M17 family metallopeptidase [Metamycoplasmataceae bacterium]